MEKQGSIGTIISRAGGKCQPLNDKEKGALLKEIGLYLEAQEFDSEERKLKSTQINLVGVGVLSSGSGSLIHSMAWSGT